MTNKERALVAMGFEYAEGMTRTQLINALQKRHPGTRRQRSSHGAGKISVQFFDKATGKLVADYNL